jgi:L-iditol 2-dehydrogenase
MITEQADKKKEPSAVPESMLASRLYGIRDLRLERLPRPVAGPGEVLLRVACVGICGSDVHYFLHGRIGDQVVTGPIVMGHEFSAWVAQLGDGIHGLEVGQLVAVDPGIPCGTCELCEEGHPNLCLNMRFCGTPPINGVFAEYTVMPARNCFPLPPGIGPVEGALLEPLGIGLHTVDLGHLKAGYTVAVLGAGPIGLLTAAAARAAGASAIYMTEPLAYRRDFALEYVADAVFDPGIEDAVGAIQHLTSGRGIDVAFDAAGAPNTPQQAAEMVRMGGKVILAGIPVEDRLVLQSSLTRKKGLTIKQVRRSKNTYPRAIRLVQAGRIDLQPLATHYFPLERIAEAFEVVSNYVDGVVRAVIRVAA